MQRIGSVFVLHGGSRFWDVFLTGCGLCLSTESRHSPEFRAASSIARLPNHHGVALSAFTDRPAKLLSNSLLLASSHDLLASDL